MFLLYKSDFIYFLSFIYFYKNIYQQRLFRIIYCKYVSFIVTLHCNTYAFALNKWQKSAGIQHLFRRKNR